MLTIGVSDQNYIGYLYGRILWHSRNIRMIDVSPDTQSLGTFYGGRFIGVIERDLQGYCTALAPALTSARD